MAINWLGASVWRSTLRINDCTPVSLQDRPRHQTIIFLINRLSLGLATCRHPSHADKSNVWLNSWLPGFIMGLVGITGGIAARLLPNTIGHPQPESFAAVRKMYGSRGYYSLF